MAYEINGKTYTSNSLLDEIVYHCKNILSGIIVKNDILANDKETEESLYNAEVYIMQHDAENGEISFENFPFNEKILKAYYGDDSSVVSSYLLDKYGIPEDEREDLTEFANDYVRYNFEEQNDYYRMLNGLPPYNTGDEYYIYLDSSYFPEEYYSGSIDFENTPVHEYDSTALNILYVLGTIDQLREQYTGANYAYLTHMGDRKIDIYTARRAKKWDILYMPGVYYLVRDRFRELYEINKSQYISRFYQNAVADHSQYYDEMMIVLLLAQTFNDMVVDSPEWYIRRDIFDLRSCQYFLESYGVEYFKEIPLKYQIRIVKNINRLIKYKSSNRNNQDILDIFDIPDTKIYKYYIHKKSLGKDLEFIKTEMGESYDDFIKNSIYRIPYDDLTMPDPYWDGEYDHDVIKDRILQQDFTIRGTKYLSTEYEVPTTEYQYQIQYFLGLILDSNIEFDVKIAIPSIDPLAEFKVSDLFIFLEVLTAIFDRKDSSELSKTNRIPDKITSSDPQWLDTNNPIDLAEEYPLRYSYDDNGNLIHYIRNKYYNETIGYEIVETREKVYWAVYDEDGNEIVYIEVPTGERIGYKILSTEEIIYYTFTDYLGNTARFIYDEKGKRIGYSLIDLDKSVYFDKYYDNNYIEIEFVQDQYGNEIGFNVLVNSKFIDFNKYYNTLYQEIEYIYEQVGDEENYYYVMIGYHNIDTDEYVYYADDPEAEENLKLLYVIGLYKGTDPDNGPTVVKTTNVHAVIPPSPSIWWKEKIENSESDRPTSIGTFERLRDCYEPYYDWKKNYMYEMYTQTHGRVFAFNSNADIDSIKDFLHRRHTHHSFGENSKYKYYNLEEGYDELRNYFVKITITEDNIDDLKGLYIRGEEGIVSKFTVINPDLYIGKTFVFMIKKYNTIPNIVLTDDNFDNYIGFYIIDSNSDELVEVSNDNKNYILNRKFVTLTIDNINDYIGYYIVDPDTEDKVLITEDNCLGYIDRFFMLWKEYNPPVTLWKQNYDHYIDAANDSAPDIPTSGDKPDTARQYVASYLNDDLEKLGVADFIVPNGSYSTIDEVIDIYENNTECYNKLKEIMKLNSDNNDEYAVLKYVFQELYTREFDTAFYTLGNGQKTSDLSELLKDRSFILYNLYKKIGSEANTETRKDMIRQTINDICDTLEYYIKGDHLQYIYAFTATYSFDALIRYIYLMINFFKSYKTYFLDPKVTYRIDDSYINGGFLGSKPVDEINNKIIGLLKKELKADRGDGKIYPYDVLSIDTNRSPRDYCFGGNDKFREVLDVFGKFDPYPDYYWEYDGGAPDTTDYDIDIDNATVLDSSHYPYIMVNSGRVGLEVPALFDLNGWYPDEMNQEFLNINAGGVFHEDDYITGHYGQQKFNYILDSGGPSDRVFISRSLHMSIVDRGWESNVIFSRHASNRLIENEDGLYVEDIWLDRSEFDDMVDQYTSDMNMFTNLYNEYAEDYEVLSNEEALQRRLERYVNDFVGEMVEISKYLTIDDSYTQTLKAIVDNKTSQLDSEMKALFLSLFPINWAPDITDDDD